MLISERLPRGVMSNDVTFHAGIHDEKKYKMHSCTIFSHGLEFVSGVRREGDSCSLYVHTDYTIQVCSERLFVRSVRNSDGKFLNILVIFTI